jgi:hypothetical protein
VVEPRPIRLFRTERTNIVSEERSIKVINTHLQRNLNGHDSFFFWRHPVTGEDIDVENHGRTSSIIADYHRPRVTANADVLIPKVACGGLLGSSNLFLYYIEDFLDGLFVEEDNNRRYDLLRKYVG